MADQSGNSVVEKIVLALVVAIPIIGIGVYLLNQKGFFDQSPSTQAPGTAQQATSEPQTPAAISIDNESALPTSVSAGDLVPFSFTIKNPGSSDGTYQYKVSVEWNSGENDVIDVNSIPVAAGASKDISESLKFETAPATAEVTVEVEPSGPSVTFVLPR